MKRINILFSTILALLLTGSCNDPVVEANFEDQEDMTIYNYIAENDSLFGPFLKILKSGNMELTLGAYNPHSLGYTLFLPDSLAIQEFVDQSNLYSSIDELVNDRDYCSSLSRYHVVDLAIDANDFPFGALPAYTLTGDFLTISFVSEPDTSYYNVNNQAPIIQENIELSNGFIHVINKTLNPITFTTFDWIVQHEGYEIFAEAVEMTGFDEVLDIDLKDPENSMDPVTLLLEADSVLSRFGINNIDDLVSRISPDNSDYSDPENPLYNFVGYHILTGTSFLDDFTDESTNYTTYSQIPLSIDGQGIDLAINKEKVVFDTIIENQDTTIIDFVGFYYDHSNILTKSGAVHLVNQFLEQQPPSQEEVYFSFWEEPLFNEFRNEPGEYIIEDPDQLRYFTWSGADLVFVKSADEDHPAWSQDYILMDGDFSISYTVPPVVQGNYTLYIRADRFSSQNALVEVYLDGRRMGGLIDLSTGGSTDNPFGWDIALGTINFVDYNSHTITIRSLIPGRFIWDHVRFDPIINEFEK